MIIKIENKNVLFIEPPKNATTSIRQWFFKKTKTDEGLNNLLKRHCSLQSMIDTIDMTYDYMFTVIRHPLDRLVSDYMYIKKLAIEPTEAVKTKNHTKMCYEAYHKYKSFETFVKTGIGENLDEFPLTYLKEKTQTSMLSGKDGFSIPKRLQLLRFENLNTDFHQLLDKMLGSEVSKKYKAIPLPFHNKTKRMKLWRSYYDDQTLQIAKEFYKTDLVNFDYKI